MNASEFMSHPAVTIDGNHNAEEAARLMIERQIDCLPVVDPNGDLIGIVTPSDYATRNTGIPFSVITAPQLFGQWLPPGGIEEIYRTARATPLQSIMRTDVVTCRENTTLDEAVRMLVGRNVHHLVVMRGRKPVGVIARHDLLKAMMYAMQENRSAARVEIG